MHILEGTKKKRENNNCSFRPGECGKEMLESKEQNLEVKREAMHRPEVHATWHGGSVPRLDLATTRYSDPASAACRRPCNTYPCIVPLPSHSIVIGAARCRCRRVRTVRRWIVDSCAHVRALRADACRCRCRPAAFSRAGISIAIPGILRGRVSRRGRWIGSDCGSRSPRHVCRGETIDTTGRAWRSGG